MKIIKMKKKFLLLLIFSTIPTNNTVAQATSLSLLWNPDPNATSYDVQVATNNTFTSIISSGNVTATSGLTQGTAYFWRVSSKNAICTGTFGTPFSFTTGILSCGTNVISTSVPVVISASGTPTVTSTINIPSGGNIGDVNVNLNVNHSYVSDLSITLKSPSNTVVTLFSNSCGSNDNINAIFDDAGSPFACLTSSGASTYAVSGTIIPSSSLSAFNGESLVGTWTLTISDGFNTDGGALNNWSLNFCTLDSLGTQENSFQDFALYPNPNEGNFNIKLTSYSNENIFVLIHDISGRQVYEKSFVNSGVFDQNINLNTIKTGIYFVTITDGFKKMKKKIIVE